MNTKSYKKYLPLMILVLGMVTLIGCRSLEDGHEKGAREFLDKYYSVEDTESMEFFHQFADADYEKSEDALEEFVKAVENEYSPFMTEEGLQTAMSNRFIPGGEMYVMGQRNRIQFKTLEFDEFREYDDGRIYYSYSASLNVLMVDGDVQVAGASGEMVMKEEDGKWKVDVFRPNNQEIYQTLHPSDGDSAIIGGGDGPTEIVVAGGEFQYSLQKIARGGVERTVQVADNCSIDILVNVMVDSSLRSAAWEGIDVNELAEYYILTDNFADQEMGRDKYIYIQEGEIFYQNGLEGMRTNISQESYKSIESFFTY